MRKIVSFLLAFVAINVSAQTLISVTDQSITDWDKLPQEYVASATCNPECSQYQAMRSLKVYADLSYINILMEVDFDKFPSRESVQFHFFFDSSNTSSTGYTGWLFNDYSNWLMEGLLYADYEEISGVGVDLFKWPDSAPSSTDWVWTDDYNDRGRYSDFACQHIVAGGREYFEMRFLRDYIPADWNETQFGIGADIMWNWESVGVLPNAADEVTGESTKTVLANMLKVNIDPVNRLQQATIDNISYAFFYPNAYVVAGQTPYSGNVVIPSTITYHDSVYNVTGINASAFENCFQLTAVTIPSSVTSIGYQAFYNCQNLNSISCKATTPPTCGADCFKYVRANVYIYVPQASENTYKNTSPWSTFTNYNSNSCGDDLRWTYADGILIISGTGDMSDYNSYWISENTLSSSAPWSVYAETITQVIISDNVNSIGNYAFCDLKNLQMLSIGKNVKSIGSYAFYNCASLSAITLPSSVTSIDYLAFCRCNSLTSLIIPASVTEIGTENFENCAKLQSLEIKGTEVACKGRYLSGCPAIETIIAPASFYNSGVYASSAKKITVTAGELEERGCYSIVNNYKHLKTLDVSATTNTTLSDEAFMNCYNLESIKLPSQLRYIPYMAIAGCVNLKSVVIPASVVDIDQRAFEDCRSLSSITFAGTNVQRIGSWAFYNAHQLTNLTLPQGVSEIGDAAFYGCAYLKDLKVPTSARKLGDNCFALCSKLEGITITALAPPTIAAKTFYDVDRAIPVYVPANSLNAYKNADVWKEFTNLRTIAAETQTMTEETVVVAPDANQVVLTWPKTDEAATYQLMLYKDGEVVCTITFNNQGQLLTIGYAAPSRGVANDVTYADNLITGFKYAIGGLLEGTTYTYVITAADANGDIIPTYCYSAKFQTNYITAIDENAEFQVQQSKFLNNGQLYILRDGKMYNAVGNEMK